MLSSTMSKKQGRRTQAERRDATREKILCAAVELLKRKGYAGFRIVDVTKEAQVSRGAQTHHFPTKNSLLLAALEQVYMESSVSSVAKIQSLKPGENPLDLLIQEAEEFFLGPSFSIAMDMLNIGDGEDPQLRAQVQEMSRDHRLPLEARWIQAFVDVGVDQETAQDVVWMTYTIFRGLALRALLQKDTNYNLRLISEWRVFANQKIASKINHPT